ncbi:MAG: hypothetical protein KTR18_05100 [Acidiferrobacterales bacterium]|nr:hypothetical protein [Acidiferrobacterales bacterium]
MPTLITKVVFLAALMLTHGQVVASDDEGIQFEICYDFGCRSQSQIVLSGEEWRSVTGILNASSAAQERKRMKEAIARMEVLAGHYSPIHQDLAMNLPIHDVAKDARQYSGQLDCIDESINTTRFLNLFSQQGLLRFHDVLDRAYRRSFIRQHWAAQIEDRQTGKRYVIDSWFENNGEPPVLVSSERWHDLSL